MGSQAIDLLWVVGYLLGTIILTLIVIATFTRTFKKWRRELHENRKKEYSTTLLGYLTGNILLQNFENFIRRHPESIPSFFEISNELQVNLRGPDKENIQRLFRLKFFSDHYMKLLNSGVERKIMEALIFLRELEYIEPYEINQIKSLLEHPERHIVHAAAVTIMASGNTNDRGYALRLLCRDREVTRLALYEVLYRFRKRDREQWLEEGKQLTLLITDPSIPLNHRTSIAIAMGGMGYFYHSRYLLDLLQNTPLNEKNIPFIAGLIEGLGMLHNPETIVEIQRILLLTNSYLVIRASIRALRQIDGEDGIPILFQFLSRKYDLHLQIEAAIQILNLDVLSFNWISEKLIPDDADPEIVRQIKAEIGIDNYIRK